RDGFTVLRELREARVTLPVLVLTARDSVRDTAAVTAAVAEPAIADPGQLPLRPRPSLQAVRGSESRTVDLTAEDDTQAMPRYAFDSLEAKLSEMERKLG
ncbi:hypothetical protein ACFC0K_23420, partial [Streptomyces hydrogenans]